MSEIINQFFSELEQQGNFDISVCNNTMNIEDNPKYKKLELTSSQKMQMSALTTQLPAVMAASGMSSMSKAAQASQLYVLKMPEGVQGTLMQLKNGGYANMLRGSDGKFLGYAPMYQVENYSHQLAVQSAMLGTFSVMSLATGQYFLAQINSELDKIKMGTDKILEFLYGDKKAELISEISFIKYAYQNYNAISDYAAQRIATISGIQQAKKVAMKDCQFYIQDMESTMQKESDVELMTEKLCSIKESMELALQLCVMSSVLEVYYSQNFNSEFLKYIEEDVTLYINKCENTVRTYFGELRGKIQAYKGTPLKKINKDALMGKVNDILKSLDVEKESPLKQSLRSGLYSSGSSSAYYLTGNGDIYIKAS